MSGIANSTISKIDKEKPQITNAESTTNSIEIQGTDEGSGIIGYALTTQNEKPTNFLNCTNSKNITIPINSLDKNKTYYAWLKDEAGNISESRQIATKEIPISQGNITFSFSPDDWTTEKVTVTGTSKIAGYTVQLSETETFPETAEEIKSITVNSNKTIYARIVDSRNQANGYATTEVTKIDKEAPIITEIKPGQNSIQIKAKDTGSGIEGYAVTTNNTEPTTYTQCVNTKELDITINGLEQGTQYYIWVKDKLEHKSQSQATTTKQLVTGITLNEENISLGVGETKTIEATVNPSNAYNKALKWTSDNTNVVTVENGEITGIGIGTATITVSATDGSGISKTCVIEITIQTTLLTSVAKPGDYVEYDSRSEYEGLWQVLYNDSTYGLQIVSADTVGTYKIGGTNLSSCVLSTNSAINNLNNFCAKYRNTIYATNSRCLGTDPLKPTDTSTTVTLAAPQRPSVKITGVKEADTNYLKDISAIKEATSQSENGIDGGIEGYYWLGSRSNYESGYCCGTRIRVVYLPTIRTGSYGCYYYGPSDSATEYDNQTCNVRPVITLKNDIMTEIGEEYGCEEKPYKLIVN